MGGVDTNPNLMVLPQEFHHAIHLMTDNLPPHIGLIAIMAWTRRYDHRRFPQQSRTQAAVYDVFRDIGRDKYADIGSIYVPKAIYDGSKEGYYIGKKTSKNQDFRSWCSASRRPYREPVVEMIHREFIILLPSF